MKFFIRPDYTITGEKEVTEEEFDKFIISKKEVISIITVPSPNDELYYCAATKVGDLLIARVTY